MTPAQQRLLHAWGAGAPSPESRERQARDRFEAAPERFRVVFERLTGQLAAVLLSDPENGEVLGAAVDLIDAVEPPERQPAWPDPSADELAVVLAAGARDRLRRSVEFERVANGATPNRTVFEHAGPPAIRIAIAASGGSGEVSMSRP